MTYLQLFSRYLGPQKGRASLLAFVILAGIAMQILNPQFVKRFIDGAESGSPIDSLVWLGIFFLGASLLAQLFAVLAAWQGAHVGWRATNMLRSDLAEHCLALDMTFHNERTPGELIERIDGDVTALANFFSQFVVRIAGGSLLILGILVAVTIEDYRMGIGVAVYAAVTVGVLIRMRRVATSATELEREASAVTYGFVEERLAGIEDIRANGGGPYALRSMQIVLRSMLERGRRAWMRRSTFWFVLITLFSLGDVVALGLGSELLGSGSITVGSIIFFYMYAQLLWEMVDQIIQQMAELQKALAGIERISEILAIEPKLHDEGDEKLPEGPLSISFEDLSFHYNERDPILQDISFELAPGRVLGLLGRTGSGKTTLTRLLFRLYDPVEGLLRVGGIEPRTTERSHLRSRVAMVTQEVQLFAASVRDNLTFFEPGIPDEKIMAVLEELGLGSWFSRLEQGLDTIIGVGGEGLSAGEAQLLAFTRVFLHDPGLVVLDEPSSRLDPATEQLLERAMTRLLADRTGIIIAHRLATVERADEIMILEDGRIVEHGEEKALAADTQSRYYGMKKGELIEEKAG